MAKSIENFVMQGASGKVGKMLVFRQRADQTIIAKRPRKNGKPASEDQIAVMSRFTEAAYYAKAAIADPEMKQAYQQKAKLGQSAYNVAFADYMSPPQLRKAFVEGYNGQPDDLMTFRIFDNFEVKSVAMKVLSPTDELIEEGAAVQQINKMDWVYTASETNPTVAGSKLILTITDTPNNVTTVVIELG